MGVERWSYMDEISESGQRNEIKRKMARSEIREGKGKPNIS